MDSDFISRVSRGTVAICRRRLWQSIAGKRRLRDPVPVPVPAGSGCGKLRVDRFQRAFPTAVVQSRVSGVLFEVNLVVSDYNVRGIKIC